MALTAVQIALVVSIIVIDRWQVWLAVMVVGVVVMAAIVTVGQPSFVRRRPRSS
jgi:hypothetical protein